VVEPPEARLEYFIVGVSHRTGTAALRERLFVDEAGQATLLASLRAAGMTQALVLSTCDRTELHAVVDDAANAASMLDILARQGRVTPGDIVAQGYQLRGTAALRHLCAVAASLDSVVLGEPQVLGQVKDATACPPPSAW